MRASLVARVSTCGPRLWPSVSVCGQPAEAEQDQRLELLERRMMCLRLGFGEWSGLDRGHSSPLIRTDMAGSLVAIRRIHTLIEKAIVRGCWR